MALESAKGLPAYRIPPEIKKRSWSKKRKRKKGGKNKSGIPEDISEIIRI